MCIFTKLNAVFILKMAVWTKNKKNNMKTTEPRGCFDFKYTILLLNISLQSISGTMFILYIVWNLQIFHFLRVTT